MKCLQASGFTLVEMIVVVGIIGILSTVVVLQFTGTNRNFSLQNAQSFLRSDLRRVMTYASTGKTCCTDQAVPEGYGLLITPGNTTYELYADVDGDHMYTSGGVDQILETIDAQTGESVVGVTPASDVEVESCGPVGTSGLTCDFLTAVPGGVLYANGQSSGTFQIILRQTKSSVDATKKITVDLQSGQVE